MPTFLSKRWTFVAVQQKQKACMFSTSILSIGWCETSIFSPFLPLPSILPLLTLYHSPYILFLHYPPRTVDADDNANDGSSVSNPIRSSVPHENICRKCGQTGHTFLRPIHSSPCSSIGHPSTLTMSTPQLAHVQYQMVGESTFSMVTFEGPVITVDDLKTAIIRQRKIPTDKQPFDLRVTDHFTGKGMLWLLLSLSAPFSSLFFFFL